MNLRPADLLECVRHMSDLDKLELVSLINKETQKPAFLPSNEEVDFKIVEDYIRSSRHCRNCGGCLLQSAYHYRCISCGDVESLGEITNDRDCPRCGKKSYAIIDNHPSVIIFRCRECKWEDQIVKH